MSEGERMVWAAEFAAGLRTEWKDGRTAAEAAVWAAIRAASSVLSMRDAATFAHPGGELMSDKARAMLVDMLGNSSR